MPVIGPSHPCLIFFRETGGGKLDPGIDGVIGDSLGAMLRAVEVNSATDATADADLLILPSHEITHRQLVEAAARSGLPTALCTHGATLKEITRAAGWHQLAFRGGEYAPARGRIVLQGGGRLVLVHGGGNIRAQARIAAQTFLPVGYEGPRPDLAVAAGAMLVIAQPGQTAAIREAEQALGSGRLSAQANAIGRRCIVAARPLRAGAVVTPGDIALAQVTGGEFAPYQQDSVVGRRLLADLAAGQPLQSAQLDGTEAEAPQWFAPRPPRAKPD
ncbi:MAG: flagella basal body P-ring formation protein FlgA [Planctomycetes bacterium]|nr:flagella basal body P-ring formation protein FlgA [Planctomycetota bacterium]